MDQETTEPETAVKIDARGHRCPVPSLRLQTALAIAAPGTRLVLLADDPLARIDVPHLLTRDGHELLGVQAEAGGGLRFEVRKSFSAAVAARGRSPD